MAKQANNVKIKVPKTTSGTPVQPDKFPTWFDLVVMIVIFFVATLVAALCMKVTKSAAPHMEQELLNVIVYSIQFILAIGGIFIYRHYRGAKQSVFHFSAKWYNASLMLLGIVLILATSVVIEPLMNLFPEHYFEDLNRAIGRGGWSILMTVVLASIFEEMLFRGLILESVRQKWGATIAIVLSATLFGLVHLPNLPQVLNAFVMGIIMGYIYVLTDSLISVIIIHAVNNGLAYLLLEVTGTQASDLRGMIGNDTWYFVIFGASLVIFLGSLVAMAIIATDKMKKRGEIAAVFHKAPEPEEETLAEQNPKNNN